MILNADELLSLVHPPSASVRSVKLRRELKETKASPAITEGHRFVLGDNVHQGERKKVCLSPKQRLRHIHLIGATGTGKSTLLLKLITQDIANGSGFAVLDPHGDLIDRILESIPDERADDVVLLDPADTEYPKGLNILSAYSEVDKTVLSSDLVAVFRRLSTSWGGRMNSVFSNAILAFLESSKGGTLADLRRFLVEKKYRTEFLKTVSDNQVLYYWKKEFPLLKGKIETPILTRLDTFLRPKPVRNMVCQKQGLNFQEILESGKIFLAKLSQGLIGEENAYLLGTLLVSKLHQVAMARQAKKESQRQDFYLYVDEFQNFVTKSMSEILSGARKYHFGLVLAHQGLRQLWSQNSDLAQSVISNPGTRVCFRMGDFDAKKLEDGFSFFRAQDLQNLGVGEAIARVERAEYDFNLEVVPAAEVPSDLSKKRRESLIDLCRKKYSRSREEVERELSEKQGLEEKPEPDSTPSGEETGKAKAKSKRRASKKQGKKPEAEGTELLPEEEAFLKFISGHPGMFVTKAYGELELSSYKGDKLKKSLISKGLLYQEETREGSKGRLAKVLSLTDEGSKEAAKLKARGKGGELHTQLQNTIAEQAKVFGWKAQVEKKVSRSSLQTVDVELRKQGMKVAVEIASFSRVNQEIGNLTKCLEAGYDYVLAVSSDPKQLASLKTESKKAFSFKERERIRFYHSSEVKNFFAGFTKPGIVSENSNVSGQITGKKQPGKQLLGSKEAAEYLGISINTLYEWTNQNKIPYIKVGRTLKFKVSELEKWLERRSRAEKTFDFPDDR